MLSGWDLGGNAAPLIRKRSIAPKHVDATSHAHDSKCAGARPPKPAPKLENETRLDFINKIGYKKCEPTTSSCGLSFVEQNYAILLR